MKNTWGDGERRCRKEKGGRGASPGGERLPRRGQGHLGTKVRGRLRRCGGLSRKRKRQRKSRAREDVRITGVEKILGEKGRGAGGRRALYFQTLAPPYEDKNEGLF